MCIRVAFPRAALLLALTACVHPAGTGSRGGPSATSTAITEGDLRSRIFSFADDSMHGRLSGTADAIRGTEYIARELRRLRLEPAGDGGTYFQKVPLGRSTLDSASTIHAESVTLRAWKDFATQPAAGAPSITGRLQVVYAGAALDTMTALSPEQVRGKLVLLTPPTAPIAHLDQLLASAGYKRYEAMTHAAVAMAVVTPGALTPELLRAAYPPTLRVGLIPDQPATGDVTFLVSREAAEALMGVTRTAFTPGMTGRTITADVRFSLTRLPAQNVVAVLRGSDPSLRSEYVALGAHSDHVGFRAAGPVDHDSMRAFNGVVRPEGAEAPARVPTEAEWARIRFLRDSLHAAHGGARPDSINNGADDDGSGSMGLLEIAESFAGAKQHPRRSLLFVWHVGEEQGMLGSRYFTDHPTVPRDSIVTQLNIDMIGRGGSADMTGTSKEGTPLYGRDEGYLQLIGSRRLSTELGDLVERVNDETHAGFHFDYALDANGHPGNIYCRSDHAMYARYGIPVTFFTTGGHRDYHQVTDEPQYLRFDQYRRVTQFIRDLAERVADLDHQPVVDKPKPDPKAECKQ